MSLPGTTLPEVGPIPQAMINWSDLAALTKEYVTDPALEDELLRLIREAQQADQLGQPERKEQALRRFFGLVDRSNLRVITAAQADVLRQIAGSL